MSIRVCILCKLAPVHGDCTVQHRKVSTRGLHHLVHSRSIYWRTDLYECRLGIHIRSDISCSESYRQTVPLSMRGMWQRQDRYLDLGISFCCRHLRTRSLSRMVPPRCCSVSARREQPPGTSTIQSYQRIRYPMNTHSDLHRSDIRARPRMLHKSQHRDSMMVSSSSSQYSSRFPRLGTYQLDTVCMTPLLQQ